MSEQGETDMTPEEAEAEFEKYLARLREIVAEEVRLHGPFGIPVHRLPKNPDLIAEIAKRTKERLANPPSRSTPASEPSSPASDNSSKTN
jgi:hypothetical protein